MDRATLSYCHGTSSVPLLGQTIGDNLRDAVERYPDHEALVIRSQNFRATYQQFWDLVTACARGLLALGVEAGDRVGIWAPNRYEWVVVQYASARIGAILVNVNPAYQAPELEYVLNQAGVSVLLYARGFRQSDYVALLAAVRERCPELRRTLLLDAEWNALLDQGRTVPRADLEERAATLQFDDPINIQYTSGTTGFPKGATLTHHNILNNGYFLARSLGYTESERVCVPVPFYHCFGMVLGNLACTSHGACIVVPGEGFNPLTVLETVQAERCTSLYGVPTMFRAVLEEPTFANFDVSSLRTGVMAGAPCPIELMRSVVTRLHMPEVAIGYGMTETSPISTLSARDDTLERRVATVGRVLAHVEISVRGPGTTTVLPRGEPGEFCTRGPSVMRGYWRDEAATARSIDAAGWMHSGDLAVMDDAGYVKIVGRLKDMIIRGGENISPAEIEAALHGHPDVSEAQVIGVPSRKYGEEVMAWVRARPGATLAEDALTAFCKRRLALFKVPRYWRFVEAFPMTVTGKVQKYRLREMAVELLGRHRDAAEEMAWSRFVRQVVEARLGTRRSVRSLRSSAKRQVENRPRIDEPSSLPYGNSALPLSLGRVRRPRIRGHAMSVATASPLKQALLHHITYSLGSTVEQLSPRERFLALALAVRDQMIDGLLETDRRVELSDCKRLYYLSMEFLLGRSLRNNLANLGLLDEARTVLAGLGLNFDEVEDCEVDAALGNGGLGRLAACFLDSLATLGLPGFGYGINYEYGLFKQEIRNGEQVEKADNWRTFATPWTIERPQEAVLVPLYGRIEHATDRKGLYNPMWLDWKVVIGVPHDFLIAGYGRRAVNYLRLFAARASQEVDMSIFNYGDYLNAVQSKVLTETISKVLYPSADVQAGRELRLVQEYFLSTCAVRDVVRRHLRHHDKLDNFSDKIALQLNDTHPTLAIVELMRLLVDENDFEWDPAWEITRATFAYTNHTLLPEALERWSVALLEHVLPRHLQLIYEINTRFLKQVSARYPGDTAKMARMSLVEEGDNKQMRMANLAILAGHSVNGVAAVHSELVKTELVPDFAQMFPERFNNKTNGVTPRRWLLAANPGLAALITEVVGPGWVTDLDKLRGLERVAHDSSFQDRFRMVKQENKLHLARMVRDATGVALAPDALFDVQVKRIHEYKRQLLNVLHIVHEYLCLVEDGRKPTQPRVYVFAGKAAPGYVVAKQIIRLINDVASVVNADPRAAGHIKVVFVPDYRVTLAEVIIPAADLSEQISTAGTEASGTGNMKFAMNGALTIGTLDGANIEIREEVGADNIFIFGLTVDEVRTARAAGYRPGEVYRKSPAVRRVMDALRSGRFCPGQRERHAWVAQRLLADGEQYFHLADLDSYLEAHEAAARLYRDRAAWSAKAILNVARTSKFSSDRTILEYARDIWNIKPV